MLWACCRRFFSVVRWRRCSWGCSSSSLASTSPSLVAACDGDGGSFGNVDNSDVIGADLCELAIKQTKFIRRMSAGKKKVVTSHLDQKRVLSFSQERSWCTLRVLKRGLVACKTCIGRGFKRENTKDWKLWMIWLLTLPMWRWSRGGKPHR